MKKVLDIIKNWNRGKEEHDERVRLSSGYMSDQLVQALHDRARREQEKMRDITRIDPLIESIKTYRLAEDKDLEAKHWQILAEYAQDQVKALTKVSALDLSDGSTVKVDREEATMINGKLYVNVRSDKSILDKAEERHGFTMSKE